MRSTDSSARRGFSASTRRSTGAPARSRSAGATSGTVTASASPAPTSTSAARRRSRCGCGQAADLLVGTGHGAPDGVEADAAGHLLDQVDLALEVGAERRRAGGDLVAGAVDRDPERPE